MTNEKYTELNNEHNIVLNIELTDEHSIELNNEHNIELNILKLIITLAKLLYNKPKSAARG